MNIYWLYNQKKKVLIKKFEYFILFQTSQNKLKYFVCTFCIQLFITTLAVYNFHYEYNKKKMFKTSF